MNWIANLLVAVQVRQLVGAILAAQEALSQEEEEAGAYIHLDLDAHARTIALKTGNRFSGSDLDEVRRGHIGDWNLIWERSGEDYLPVGLRTWLLEHTRVEATEREAHEDSEPYDYNEHYWDTYPW